MNKNGELHFTIPVAPASQQSKRSVKDDFCRNVTQSISEIDFLLTGDVSIAVEWLVSERERYESDRAPDVDNILKPLIDSLVGPDGIMIDDNQVQHISCSWIDSYDDQQSIRIEIKYRPDEWQSKEGIFFVQFENGLCVPLNKKIDIGFQKSIISTYENSLSTRNKLIDQGVSYYETLFMMPVQRMFHRSRIRNFEIVDANFFDRSEKS